MKVWQLGDPVISADWIALDEDQDTPPVVFDVLRRQRCPKVMVGDENQTIYEYLGTVNAAEEYPNAPKHLLTQSFRFGVAIADVANAVLASLEKPTTLRLKGLPSIDSKVGPVPDPKCILCRTNAVAVRTVLTAITEGRRPFLVGGGAEVISFVEGAQDLQQGRATSHPDLACFADWPEVQSYVKEDEGEELKLMANLTDAFGCEPILAALRNMPEEKDADLVVSTAHKSKGREWDSVRLAEDFPTDGKSSDSDRRLAYVAATRARLLLDVTQCPFFTGDDSLGITFSRPDCGEGIVPPAPVAPPVPDSFSWSKGKDGDWLVRGPAGRAGETVEVVRKDGSSQRKVLRAVVWDGNGTATYRV